MTRPVYSTLFVAQHAVTTATFTCPTGYVAVVRDVDVFYAGGLGTNVQLENVAGGIFVYMAFALSSDGSSQMWRGRQVLNAGEYFTLTSTDPIDLMVSGYLLTVP